MKCDWASGACPNVVVEIWHPKEGSKVVDQGVVGYCKEHGLHGEARAACCARVGYSFAIHQHVLQLEWFIRTLQHRLSFVPGLRRTAAS